MTFTGAKTGNARALFARRQTGIRYGMCWEDADVLLAGLDIQPGDICLAIASAGDNVLAMLAQAPGKVIAIDVNPAQIACLELRVAAYRMLAYRQMLKLLGFEPCADRMALYRHCRSVLSESARLFWDEHPNLIIPGIVNAGKLERYFLALRKFCFPLIHNDRRINRLWTPNNRSQRQQFFQRCWNNRRWRGLFKLFASRFAISHFARDPVLHHFVETNIADHLAGRFKYALTILEPEKNPYLQWLMTGRFISARPYALREENYLAIRKNLDRLEWRCCSLEDFLAQHKQGRPIDKFNLSDVFEYSAEQHYQQQLAQIINVGHSGSRLLYWNLLVDRQRPESLCKTLEPLVEQAKDLFASDKAFFYQRLVLERIC